MSPCGATGPAGAAGPAGPAGAVGPAGPQGPAGDTGATGPAGKDGNTVLSGAGAPASSVGSDGHFYVDTAADVLYGPKAGGTWPATGTSLIGPQGPKGDPGSVGPAGPKGDPGPQGSSITSIADLNGVACTTSGGNSGTISVSVGSGNAVTLTCVGKGVCTHSNGVGQNYTDCSAAPGEPGNPATYGEQMAQSAAQAYVDANAGSQVGGLFGCPGGALMVVVTDPANNSIISWQFTGSLAGYVHTSTSSQGPQCPNSSYRTWN